MRKRMSAKRYLLIAAALCFVVILSAKISTWIYGSGYNLRTGASEHLTGYDLNSIVSAPIGKYNLELENRFVFKDREQAYLQERLDERVQLTLDRKWESYYAKAFYRGEWFDKSYGWIMPTGSFMPYYERNFNQAGLSGTAEINNFKASLNARYRAFSFQPVFPDFTDEIQGKNLKADAEVAYTFYKPLAAYIRASDKAALDDKTELYDVASVGTGLKLDLPLSPIRGIQAQSGIDWIDSDALASDRLIPVTTNLRYHQMLNPQLTGFATYELRNFYDRENASMLLNSMFLRASGKYTLTYDYSHGSFVELGGKFAPRGNVTHKSSAAFLRSELKVWGDLYLGGGVNHMPSRYTHYEALARYFVTPVSEVFVDYVYSDDIEYKDFTTYTSAGLRLNF
jgi:hypothetical protein